MASNVVRMGIPRVANCGISNGFSLGFDGQTKRGTTVRATAGDCSANGRGWPSSPPSNGPTLPPFEVSPMPVLIQTQAVPRSRLRSLALAHVPRDGRDEGLREAPYTPPPQTGISVRG